MLGSISELSKYRLIGLSMSCCVFGSYIVSDQNACTGGNWFAAKVNV